MILGKVKFTGKGGYKFENDLANSILKVGQGYECDDVNIGSCFSEYHLVGLVWDTEQMSKCLSLPVLNYNTLEAGKLIKDCELAIDGNSVVKLMEVVGDA